MDGLTKEAGGPSGDRARHRALGELDAALRALPAAPRDAGHVALLVRRRADGARETPERVRLTPENGLEGDGWSRRPPRDPEAQVSVMQHAVATLLANGQPLALFGDNLLVELDLSEGNLPSGSRVRVGDAVVAVTPKPHNGCRKFLARVGEDGLRLVQAPATRHLNLRGIFWKVLDAGDVWVAAPVVVLARGATS